MIKMEGNNISLLVKEEIEKAFKENKTQIITYESLIPKIKDRLLPIKKFLDQSIVGFISSVVLADPDYLEEASNHGILK